MSKPENRPPVRTVQNRFTGASTDPAIEARLEALLQHLYTFYHTPIELSLNRTYRFLEKLGNPHLALPKTVHVAGTNGKGSTIATLRALLEASGHSVHTYTSPHLVHPTERIRLAGALIDSEALCEVLDECIEINNGDPITFFEAFTCAAFLALSRTPADWLLLETGMGGRLDTTNVLHNPAATVITTISYDHQSFLGDTLAKIAYEKAGIIKSGVPCIVGYQFDEAIKGGVMDVITKASKDLPTEAPILQFGAQWSTAPESNAMLFRYGNDSITLPRPRLTGNHQLWNAGAALAAFRSIAPDHFTPEILSTAMGQIEWPGRLQTLTNHPFNELVPGHWQVIIDGGHNDSAGIVLAEQMQQWRAEDDRPLHLVVAMVKRKDPIAFLKPLLPYVKSLTVTEIEGESTTYASDDLAAIARTLGFENVATAPTAETAIQQISDQKAKNGRILLTGSLFFMGNILAFDK